MNGGAATSTAIARVEAVFETLIDWMNTAGVAWIFALMF